MVWWARKQKDDELDDADDAPPADAPETKEPPTPADASAGEAVKAEFNACKAKAFELFKASPPRYAEAADWFSKAIDLAVAHETLAPQRTALHNNRSACRERCDDLELSLEDCAVVLATNPQHAKVRRRRARIFDKLGRDTEALVEICADLLIQREAFKKALQQGKQADQPTPVDNVESVMRSVGAAAADEVLAARKAAGTSFGMPSSNTITQLLMTYAAYDARHALAALDTTDYATSIKAARSAGDDGETIRLLLQRAETQTYSKGYDNARRDVELASAQRAKAEAKSEVFSDDLIANLERASGLYKHLVHDLAGATTCYGRALELETDPAKRVETRVRLAGVHVDHGDMAAADSELDAALQEGEGNWSDVHMHRAQLRVIRRDLEAAKNDLEACIAITPGHVLARLRLATVLIHSGADASSVEAQVEAAERLAPTMSEVYQVKGEVLLAKADLRGAIRQFDEAIRLDESNPVPLYNKGLTLIQMNQFEAHNAQKLFEAALAVDPTCMVALMRLSELKLQLAASFDQAQAVVDMLGGAMQHCRDRDELVELSTVRAMAVAQLAAARDVGLTSFQM